MVIPFNEEVPGWMGDADGQAGAGIGMGVALIGW
jgi:hypothetical protein